MNIAPLSRLVFTSVAALVALYATESTAQAGGGRGRGGEGGMQRQQAPRKDTSIPKGIAPVVDPMVAIERELPSLRLDLKLEGDQNALFDGLTRAVRDATEAARQRARRMSAFKFDDGSTVSASSIILTVMETDVARGTAMQAVNEKLEALYNTFNADQRRMFDRRMMQSQREPLGNS